MTPAGLERETPQNIRRREPKAPRASIGFTSGQTCTLSQCTVNTEPPPPPRALCRVATGLLMVQPSSAATSVLPVGLSAVGTFVQDQRVGDSFTHL